MANAEEKPSAWGVLHEYTKTVVTLATGILAFTITFMGKLIGSDPSVLVRPLLIATWAILMLAILFGLLAAAGLANYLRGKQNANTSLFCANAAFFLLVLAAVLFVALGVVQLGQKDSLGQRIQNAESEAKTACKATGTWDLRSLVWEEKAQTYQIEYQVGTTGQLIAVIFNKDLNQILSLIRK